MLVAAAASARPSDEAQHMRAWREREGGLVFFANVCRQHGVVLLTPDGRVYLPTRFLIDSACEQALMDEAYGLSMGLLPTPVAPRGLVTADAGEFQVSQQFVGLKVVVAMGTEHELTVSQDFWAIKGLGKLAQAIFPATLDHTCGSAGVDRVLGQYQYRPHMARGDASIATVPVVSHRAVVGLRAAAVGALAQVVQAPKPDPSGELGGGAGAAHASGSAAVSGAQRAPPITAGRTAVNNEPQDADVVDELGTVGWASEPAGSADRLRVDEQVDNMHRQWSAVARELAEPSRAETGVYPAGRLLWEGRVVLTAQQLQAVAQGGGATGRSPVWHP